MFIRLMNPPTNQIYDIVKNHSYLFILFISFLVLTACSTNRDQQETLSGADQFWQNLSHHCGNAYGGEITRKPEGADLLDGREFVVIHFRECGDEELRLPFHVEGLDGEWNRSRTWVIFHHGGHLELRHDHRDPDGAEEENTWYGAFTADVVGGGLTEFVRENSSGIQTGWRIEIEKDERYTYGTIYDGNYGWRLDFDLTNPIETPPAPWGFE